MNIRHGQDGGFQDWIVCALLLTIPSMLLGGIFGIIVDWTICILMAIRSEKVRVYNDYIRKYNEDIWKSGDANKLNKIKEYKDL